MSVHKIQVRNREGTEGKLTVGGNTVVLLDGKPLRGAYSFKFEVDAKSVSKVTIELYAEVEIDANVVLNQPVVALTDKAMNGKRLAIHTLSNYAPTGIATKLYTDADVDEFMEDNKELMDDLVKAGD